MSHTQETSLVVLIQLCTCEVIGLVTPLYCELKSWEKENIKHSIYKLFKYVQYLQSCQREITPIVKKTHSVFLFEAFNRTLQRCNPKNVTHSRNFPGRAHTAMQLRSHWFGNSTLLRTKVLGAAFGNL
jgi:hypothetical protein